MLVSVGLNPKGAGIAGRDLVAAAMRGLDGAIATYAGLDGVDELAVLSTRRGVELYATTRCPAAATLALRRALEAHAGRELPLFELHGADAFRHLVRIATRLEAATAGEPGIAAKVEEAFRRAVEAGTAGRELAEVVGRVLEAERRVRAEALGCDGSSWDGAAAALAEKVLGPLSGRPALVLGAGDAAHLAARRLVCEGARLVVMDRALAAAEELASELGGVARPIETLGEELLRVDAVVSTVRVAPPELEPARMHSTAASRRRRIVIVDLAAPPAIPAETGTLEDVYLCDVDDLERMMRAEARDDRRAFTDAERIVEDEVARWS